MAGTEGPGNDGTKGDVRRVACAGEAGGEVRLEGTCGKGVLGGGEVGGYDPSEAINV